MKKRVFVALDLPADIKSELIQARENINNSFEECPIRWTKAETWHITLAFLGMLDEVQVDMAKECVAEVVSLHKGFSVALEKIIWAPENEMPPKYVWAIVSLDENLQNLQNDLVQKLDSRGIRLGIEKFVPHITLGRVVQWAFRRIEPTERPEIEQEVNLGFPIESIDLMESKLSSKSAEYKIIESYPLKN